jgi:gliding motility-associated-like protein
MKLIKLLLFVFCVLISLQISAQNISLFKQLGGKIDYTMIGNTLNPNENSIDFDSYLTSTSANLAIPAGSTIKNAYIYWAGYAEGAGDFNITLNGLAITADRQFRAPTKNAFGAFKDITDQVKAAGNTTYTVTDLVPELNTDTRTGNFGGWCIVVVYENPILPVNLINIYDGFEEVPRRIEIKLNNLDVENNVGASIGFLAWEGDRAIDVGEELSVFTERNLLNPTVLSTTINPATNAFNGTNSISGSETLYNMDIDIYDIQRVVQASDKELSVVLRSSIDVVLVNTIITKLNNRLPDGTSEIVKVKNTCDTRSLEVDYVVRNLNATRALPANTSVSLFANDTFLGVFQTPSEIPVGGSLNMMAVVTVPDTVANSFDLKVTVDNNNGVANVIEIVEDNNTFVFPVTLQTVTATGNISYNGPYCTSISVPQLVTSTVTPKGTGAYTATPAGLTIDAITGSITPSTSTAGNYTVAYTIPASGSCPVFTTTATVEIISAPAPQVVSPLNYCQNTVATALTATVATGGSLLWYTAATGGVGSATAPIPATNVPGMFTFYVTQTVGICESNRVPIVVNVLSLTTGIITYKSPICLDSSAQQLVTSTVTPAGIGTFSATPAGLVINPTTGAITPNTSLVGTYTVTFAIPATATCPPFTTNTTVEIISVPAPVVVTPLSYCQNTVAPALTATSVAGGSLLWYTTPTGGTGSTTAPIPSTNIAGPSTYYVSQKVGDCESMRMAIMVNVLPQPDVYIPSGVLCFDRDNNLREAFLIDSGLDPTLYTFQWFTVNGTTSTPIANATGNSYSATMPGSYGLVVTSQPDNCVSEMTVSVVTPYYAPQRIITTSSEYFTNGQTITVEVVPPGDYEYQLNDGVFQSSNVFNNLPSGTYTITVRGTNGCNDIISDTATLVGYPNYFTPNNDGIHDTWNIWELTATQPNSVINIFDRFGKFLKQITPGGPGWDGFYNNNPAFETDYWFTVTYEEKGVRDKIFRAHFSLVR